MYRIYRRSTYTLFAFFPLFFITLFLSGIFPQDTTMYEIATIFLGAIGCAFPFIVLTSMISGIGTILEMRNGTTIKHKNDFLADMQDRPARLQYILRQLSSEDRDYLQQQLTIGKLGVSSDGELMSLDELIIQDNEGENYNSSYTG
jgi:hypothetical protein